MKNRSLEYWIGALFLVLLVNTGYIAAFSSATVFYMTNVLGHLVLGAVLAIALLFILRKTGLPAGAPIAVGFLLISFVFGAVLAYAGNVHDNSWILWSHIVAAVLGVAALIPFVWKKAALKGGGWLKFKKGFEFSLIALVALPLIGHGYKKFFPNPHDRIVNPPSPPLSMEGEGGGPEIALLPGFGPDQCRRHYSLQLLHGFRNLRRVP